jgi:hypothetical protein
VDERPDAVQFDRAEYAGGDAAPTTCAACGQALWDTYYDVNGRVCCERCRRDLELAGTEGSGPGRFLRATVYGALAGAVGAGIWYAVRAVSGYEVGLIAVLVGFMVGAAVRKGSAGRGGWRYQALAMFLTYASIVSTYVPMIAKDLFEGARKDASAPAQSTTTPASPAPGAGPAASAAPPAAAPASAPAEARKLSPGRALLAVAALAVVLFAIACVAPFLGGVQGVIGLVIIGIGLYEAWKINRRLPLVIGGPYRIGAARSPAVSASPTATGG